MELQSVTDAELLVLGLVAEMSRHGYELERVIEERGMREWTQIGFSSIYFVLGKLQKKELVSADTPPEPKARKVYSLTDKGQETLTARTFDALSAVRPTYSSVLLGMVHWPVLDRKGALEALRLRAEAVQREIARLEDIRMGQQPMPDFIDVLFDYSVGQLSAEASWIKRTLSYMSEKPWLEKGPSRDGKKSENQTQRALSTTRR
ncbi:MAG: PadR family transcriptional regulator [Pseudomonadota bacterium]